MYHGRCRKKVELVKENRISPHEYMNSFLIFYEIKLCVKKDFHDLLKQHHISDEDYEYAIEVWNSQKIKGLL